ncbi:MAG: RelA/SpoT family protein [Candidatus Dormibacteria bacterium]
MAARNLSEVEVVPGPDGLRASLLDAVAYLSDPHREGIIRAYDAAAEAHAHQRRLSGESYVEHPVQVAIILAGLHLDPDTLAAALLHDVLEDTSMTAKELEQRFGPSVAKLVEGVTKLGKIPIRSEQQLQAENIRKMLLAMAEDIRVVLIKLADRLHNMRTCAALPPERRLRIARETMDIYAPLAHRLGIWQAKWELEDLAFEQLNPEAFDDIVRRVAQRRKERETFVRDMAEILEKELSQIGIRAEIRGRPKHLYSIYQKMLKGGKDFTDIYDLTGIRVLVENVKDCYGVLGVVHSLWKPVPGRFKDYLAMPKTNMYQSLHTTVVAHTGDPIEVQIRTYTMNETAEYGVAAHWHYKEGAPTARQSEEKFSWLRQLTDWQKEMLDPETFVDAVKVDIFQDEVFVFTPRGDVLALPSASTPIDFAYRVHTEVGHRCLGAKVNGRMVPLDHLLQNGDIVEVLTSKAPHGPSRDWLAFVKTTSAREKIRAWFKKERREENIVKGKELLDKELRRLQQRSLQSMKGEAIADLARLFRFNEVNDFFAAIGYGDVSPHSAVARLAEKLEPETDLTPIPLSTPPAAGWQTGVRVLVRGESGIATTLAACCRPVMGDAIVGYTTRGKGVTVHRADCKNAVNTIDRPRLVDVQWDDGSPHSYPVNIKIEAWDRTGLLRDVASVIAENKVNMLSLEVHVYDDHTAVISATVSITSLGQLSRLFDKLEQIKDVQAVTREIA